MVATEVALAAIGAGIAVGAAGLSSGIGAGIAGAAGAGAIAEDPKRFSTAIVFQALPQTQGIYGFLIAILILMGAGLLGGGSGELPMVSALACLGAGCAIGIAGLSAIGQGISCAAGIGAVSENEEMFGRSMVFSVLPETQALYGFIVAILLLTFTGILGTGVSGLSTSVGIAAVAAGLAIGLAGLSAIGQGIVAAGSIGAAAKNPEATGKSLVLTVIPETYAIFGLLIAILIMFGVGLFG